MKKTAMTQSTDSTSNKDVTPKFVLSKKIAIRQYNVMKKASDIVAYSAKTNYEVAEILEKETDSDFSVHSAENLDWIHDHKRIWYFAQGWDHAEIDALLKRGIFKFVVDNEADLDKLAEYLNSYDNKQKVWLLLRMRMKENTVHTGKYFVYGFFSDKVNELVPFLRMNRNIEKLGLHFHRKSQNTAEWDLTREIEQMLEPETLEAIDFLNIGGGIPIKYKNYRADVLPRVFAEIEKLRMFLHSHDIKLITEPGRFISAPAVKLVATIKNIYGENIIVDCSVYNCAMDTFIASTKLEVEGELDMDEGDDRDGDDGSKGTAARIDKHLYKPYTIKGITPDSMDIFRYKVYLKSPNVGDRIEFLNAGAYNFRTDFCGLPKIRTEIVD